MMVFLSSHWLFVSSLFFFFFNDTATTEIYTLSLHDALPILWRGPLPESGKATPMTYRLASGEQFVVIAVGGGGAGGGGDYVVAFRLKGEGLRRRSTPPGASPRPHPSRGTHAAPPAPAPPKSGGPP